MTIIKATYASSNESKSFQSAVQNADISTAITAIQKDINQYLTERIIASEGSNSVDNGQNDDEEETDEEEEEEEDEEEEDNLNATALLIYSGLITLLSLSMSSV
ncbi:hypothetical protein EC973_007090 [Apophysomyces ossiformis]|uniref:EKC/KEOPS complex subunit GON7 n=1 Tax=Apophysomyces ossiformis TaxID=679940 RepID=A0A8H7ET01_9FUNG|nr:hypothetical protein EC973_007090 [Apophysomyces ossiformis]